MKRLCIYFFYDKDGIVDDYIPYLLRRLHPFCSEICVVVNGHINEEGKKKIAPYIAKLLVRENKGLDAGAYQYALMQYGFERLKQYDEVLVTNFTYFGPFYPLKDLFDTMEKKQCDWWGLYYWPVAFFVIYHHIPSFFVAYRKSLLSSAAFEKYWRTLPNIKTYEDSCQYHEQRQTPYYDARGFKKAVYMENHYKYIDDWSYHYPLKDADKLLIEDKIPFLKRRSFFMDDYFSLCGPATDRSTAYIKQQTHYPYQLIIQNIRRTQFVDLKIHSYASFLSRFHPLKRRRQAYQAQIAQIKKLEYYKNLWNI